MAAPRRSSRQAPPRSPSIAPAMALAGVVLAVPVLYFGYPGFVVTWAFIVAAAWMAPPAQFTGKKDASGFPTAAHAGETKAMQRYRFWADLKYRLIFPPSAILPGWPVYAAWLYGVWAAVAVWCLPYAEVPYVGLLPRFIDAFFVFAIVTQVAAARRRTVTAGDVSPGVRIAGPKKVRAALGKDLPLALGAGVGAALVGAVSASWLFPVPPLPVGADYAWAFLGATGGFGAGVGYWWVNGCLREWRELVAAREEWAPRWQMLKHDPAPRLTKREHIGAATVDTFTAAGAMGGAMAYWPLAPKISPTVGAGVRLAVLSVPNIDSQGQPQPGSRHPLDFQVVTWPSDALPDVTDPTITEDVAGLYIQCAMVWACDASGYARPILDEVTPIGLTQAPAPEPTEETEAALADENGTPEPPPEPEVSQRQAWGTTWMLPDGPPMSHVRSALAPAMAEHLGAQTLTDHRNGFVFIGGLTDGSTIFDPSTGVTEKMFRDLETEDVWNGRWADALKQDANPPTIQHDTYAEAKLANGTTTVYRQAFTTRKGVDPNDFFGLEPKIKATLDGAPYVAVTGWVSRGRVGERHSQAFTVYWSHDPVPSNPDTLAPPQVRVPRGGRRPRPTPPEAQQWVLAGRMSEAFKAARLAKPEVYEVKCLTTSTSRGGHIWRIALRLYGGVTLSEVRGQAEKIRQALGSEWLRVESAPDGCVIVAGASPSKVDLANPKTDEHYIASLNWEQAFLDAKVVGVGGITPTLTAVDRLPNNTQVQVLDFTLPSGLAFVDVKAKTKQMETASKNAFVEVRRHPSGKADEFRMLASEVNPMPERAPFDWDGAETGDHRIPFATNLFGEPTCYDNEADPHLLVSGQSGGGKSVVLQNFIYGAIIRGWDLWVVDPSKGAVDFNFAEPYARAVGRTVWEAKGIISAIYDEVMRRKAINSEYNCGNYRDLPDEVRYSHVLIVLDEFTSMMMPEPVPKAMDDSPETLQAIEAVKALNAARAYIGTFVGKIVREARSTGFTMVLATQALKADTIAKIPGANDLKDNMSRMIVGRATFGALMAALKAPTEAPEQPDVLPPGRGLYEGNGRTAEVVQCWFEASQAVFADHIAAYVSPLPPERRIDLSGFVEPELDVEGGRLDDEGPIVVPGQVVASAPAEPEVKDLGVIELSLDDLELSLEDLEEASTEVDEDTFPGSTTVEQPTDGAGPPVFDWDAAEALSTVESDDMPPERGDVLGGTDVAEDAVPVEERIVWDEIDPDPWTPESSAYGWSEVDAVLAFLLDFPDVREVVWLDATLDSSAPDGSTYRTLVRNLLSERGVALLHSADEPSPLVTEGSGTPADDTVNWDTVDFSSWAPAESEYGWVAIDALMTFLDRSPDVHTVAWSDPRLDADDEMGVPHRDVVEDLLNARGVTLAPASMHPEAPEVIESPAHVPDTVPAPATKSATVDSDDEFGPLPQVPAHLLVDNDDF